MNDTRTHRDQTMTARYITFKGRQLCCCLNKFNPARIGWMIRRTDGEWSTGGQFTKRAIRQIIAGAI